LIPSSALEMSHPPRESDSDLSQRYLGRTIADLKTKKFTLAETWKFEFIPIKWKCYWPTCILSFLCTTIKHVKNWFRHLQCLCIIHVILTILITETSILISKFWNSSRIALELYSIGVTVITSVFLREGGDKKRLDILSWSSFDFKTDILTASHGKCATGTII